MIVRNGLGLEPLLQTRERVCRGERDRRQGDPVRHVPHRIDARGRGLRSRVDGDGSPVGQGDACRFEAEVGRVRSAPDGEQDAVGIQMRAGRGRAADPGRSADGMCIDTQGNLYAAAGLHQRRGSSETLKTRCGVHVFAPDGKLIRFIALPEDTITNCAFGGSDRKTLYVTAGKGLYQTKVDIPGTRR